jgi:hypothetical protein
VGKALEVTEAAHRPEACATRIYKILDDLKAHADVSI